MRKLFIKLRSAGVIAIAGITMLGAGSAALAASNNNNQSNGSQSFQAVLTPQNGTNATGLATATVDSRGMGHFHITVKGLINAPHAQHVHFGPTAAHECPSKAADADQNGVVDTTEGGPAYGPVQTSLTTTGDTSASSTLAVDRFPTYSGNNTEYDRTFQLTDEQAQQIRSGLSVVVIHGIDTIMPDGKYDGDLKSDLDPSLPQEATAPAACGPLHEIALTASSTNNSDGTSSNSSSSSNGKGVAYVALVLGAIALLVSLGSMGRRRA